MHVYVCMYECMHACMYECMYVRMYVCMYECMYVYIYICCASKGTHLSPPVTLSFIVPLSVGDGAEAAVVELPRSAVSSRPEREHIL